MRELIFAAMYWMVISVACVGVLILAAFVWFYVTDFLYDLDAERRIQRQTPRPPAPRPIRVYDQQDPLEQAYLLPDAPNPVRRVA